MSVTFCGHGNMHYDDEIKNRLRYEIEKAINSSEKVFLLGGYGNFDLLVAHMLKTLRTKYPQIKSTLVIPYIDKDYDTSLYDDSVYPPLENVPRKFAIVKRNEWMVNKADMIIAYVEHDWGGAARTLKYAAKKNKDIVNLAERNRKP